MPNFISEDNVEQAILNRLQEQFGYELLNCHITDAEDLNDGSGRIDKRDVILGERLKATALRLNPGIPESAVEEALVRLTDERYAMSPLAANREVDGLIRDGIPVEFENARGLPERERVGQIARFRFDIRKGDYVITYNPEYRYYLVDEILSEYQYTSGSPGDFNHILKVSW